jgi:hypothetical protein
MPDPVVRLRNVVALCKAETVEGQDANPAANVDAFPFEIESMEIGDPYTTEDSNEATGTEISGAPLIISQPVSFRIRMRLKGAGAGVTYTALVRPPAHALLQSCGLKGLFTAAVSPTALTAGTTTSGTVATPYAATAQLYRGQRLILTGGAQAGAQPMITDYTAARLASLADIFGTALSATNSAAIAANWTYAASSPATIAERATDQPSSTFYAHGDGILTKLFALRGTPKIMADTAKPGYFEMTGTAIWGGQTNVAQPTNAVIANHAAPTLQQQTLVSPAFIVNRKPLPISQFSFDWARELETYEDPNTPNGFGAALIGGRTPVLECDPTMHADLSVRNHLADLEAAIGGAAAFPGAVRSGSVSGNRWALTLPGIVPMRVAKGTRKNVRSETLGFRAFSTGRDSAGRDGDAILCFD